MKPLITIIIPIFNEAQAIYPTLNSIIAQTHKELEIIFIDDASTDKTQKILKKVQSEDPKIKIINTNCEGFSHAKNVGLKSSKGDYVIFFKAGNLMSSNLLEYLLKLLKETNSDIATCQHIEVDEADFYNYTLEPPIQEREKLTKLTSDKYLEKLGSKNNQIFTSTCNLWNKLIKKSILEKFTFDTERHYSDNFATFDLFQKPLKIISSNQILIGFTLLNEHYKYHCFSYNDLEKLEFLQKVFQYFKIRKNHKAIKNTCIKMLKLLTEIRFKLNDYYTEIYDLDEQKKNANQKFSSLRKFLNTHYHIYEDEYKNIFENYKKILDDENFRKKFHYLYPKWSTKFTPFETPIENANKKPFLIIPKDKKTPLKIKRNI